MNYEVNLVNYEKKNHNHSSHNPKLWEKSICTCNFIFSRKVLKIHYRKYKLYFIFSERTEKTKFKADGKKNTMLYTGYQNQSDLGLPSTDQTLPLVSTMKTFSYRQSHVLFTFHLPPDTAPTADTCTHLVFLPVLGID